jgi:hypothetical protein
MIASIDVAMGAVQAVLHVDRPAGHRQMACSPHDDVPRSRAIERSIQPGKAAPNANNRQPFFIACFLNTTTMGYSLMALMNCWTSLSRLV